MYRAYGSKRSDDLIVGDAYRLKRFVRLLCFEDEEEALASLKHYNIKVTQTDQGYVISWKANKFTEPIDPEKGTELQLFAKKMDKTIECRLGGASRLAICRGQVSGKGATLSLEQIRSLRERAQGVSGTSVTASAPIVDDTTRRELAAKVAKEKAELEQKHREERRKAQERAEHERLKQESGEKEAGRTSRRTNKN
jgi:hypothetical protein